MKKQLQKELVHLKMLKKLLIVFPALLTFLKKKINNYMKAFLTLVFLILLSNLSYCQYPKTKVIDGEKIVMLTKIQADDINAKFVKFIAIIDSQKKELLKPVILDTVVIIQDDTAVTMCKAYYQGKLKECYDINRSLSKWFEETNKTAMFLDTCNYRTFRRKYKELKKIRKNRYN